MKVTMKAWEGNGKQHPPLWDVLIDGATIGCAEFSEGRVLKMGRRYIPILEHEGEQLLFPFTQSTRKAAAEYVAEAAVEHGLV